MERVTFTERARRELESVDLTVTEIVRRHAKACRGQGLVQRTGYRLKNGNRLWAISPYPHDRVFLDSPPSDLSRSLSAFLSSYSQQLARFMSTAIKEGPAFSSGNPSGATKKRRASQLRRYSLSEKSYLARLVPKSAKLRAAGLLDMLYTPDELAAELNMETRIITDSLIPEGMPHTQDEQGRLFLHGLQVRAWIENLRTALPHLGPEQVYCLGCRKVVPLIKPRRARKGSLVLLKAKCPECGAKVNRGVKAT